MRLRSLRGGGGLLGCNACGLRRGPALFFGGGYRPFGNCKALPPQAYVYGAPWMRSLRASICAYDQQPGAFKICLTEFRVGITAILNIAAYNHFQSVFLTLIRSVWPLSTYHQTFSVVFSYELRMKNFE